MGSKIAVPGSSMTAHSLHDLHIQRRRTIWTYESSLPPTSRVLSAVALPHEIQLQIASSPVVPRPSPTRQICSEVSVATFGFNRRGPSGGKPRRATWLLKKQPAIMGRVLPSGAPNVLTTCFQSNCRSVVPRLPHQRQGFSSIEFLSAPAGATFASWTILVADGVAVPIVAVNGFAVEQLREGSEGER